ncbi:MAG TPA: invasion associated locus B family protein [Gammaproteobacteria bacterium]|nr:invasion associated locus B family protein [Gammaproteobacteria bacterium]
MKLSTVLLSATFALAAAMNVASAQSSDIGGGSGGESGNGNQNGSGKNNVERFQDWAVRCGKMGNDNVQGCVMFQSVSEKKNNKQVMRISIGYPTNADTPIAVFQLPLGMHLPPGVAFAVDDGDAVHFPVQFCFQQGCRADLQLKDDLLNTLKNGKHATVEIQDPRGRPVKLPVSLMGFTAAMQRINK